MSAAEPVTREQARELAERELEKAVYHRDRPSFLDKMLDQIRRWVEDLLPDPPSPGVGHGGGGLTQIVLVILLAVVVAAVLWWMRGRGNPAAAKKALLDDVPTRAADHRAEAERMAAEGRYAEAIRERLRAIARNLEERAILQPRPGRTALELAVEASAALPVDLMPGARVFDDVWYGDRPGTPENYALLVSLDDAVRAAKPRPLEAV